MPLPLIIVVGSVAGKAAIAGVKAVAAKKAVAAAGYGTAKAAAGKAVAAEGAKTVFAKAVIEDIAKTGVIAGVSAGAWAADKAYKGYYGDTDLQEHIKALKQACDRAYQRNPCSVRKVSNVNGDMYRFTLDDDEWMDAITVWIKGQQVFVRIADEKGAVGFQEVFPGEVLEFLIEQGLVPRLPSWNR